MAELVKTALGLAKASVKTVEDLAIASVSTMLGLDNTASGGGSVSLEGSVISIQDASGGANSSNVNAVGTVPADADHVVMAVSTYFAAGSTYFSNFVTCEIEDGTTTVGLTHRVAASAVAGHRTALFSANVPAAIRGNSFDFNWDWEGSDQMNGNDLIVDFIFFSGVHQTTPLRVAAGYHDNDNNSDTVDVTTGAMTAQTGDYFIARFSAYDGAGKGMDTEVDTVSTTPDSTLAAGVQESELVIGAPTGNVTVNGTVTATTWRSICGMVLQPA